MNVVALTSFVIEAQDAHFIDHVGESVFIVMRRSVNVSGGHCVYQGWRRGVPLTASGVPSGGGAGVPVGRRGSTGSVCGGFGEEAVSDEFAVVVDRIEMDMQTGIGGELLKLLRHADEAFPMTQLLGEEFIECGQE